MPSPLLPEHLNLPGATPARIERCERDAGIRFPDDYRAFLMQSDGRNGPVGRGYMMLWSLAEYSAGNSGYELDGDMAGVFYIGSNAGPTAYAVDWGAGTLAYVSTPFVPAVRSEVRVLGTSFQAFVEAVAAGEGW